MDRIDRILEQWRRERPELDVGPMGLLGRLNTISRAITQEMEATFAKHGLNRATFDVLATLRRSGEPFALSPGALLGAMMVTSGTMTNRIDQLEKAGLVKRRPNPDDGRGFLVELTADGRARVDAALVDHVETQGRLTARLSPSDRAVLDAVLRRYLNALEAEQ